MAPDPLRPEAVLQAMADALPTPEPGDTTPALSSSYEALALFVHACMTNLGFRLLGFDEDKPIGTAPSPPPVLPSPKLTPPRRAEAECAAIGPRLPARWNASFNSLAFVYAHTQSSMRFVVRVDRLGGQAAVRALAVGADRVHSLDVAARDYVSSASLPLRIPTTTATAAEAEDQQQQPPQPREDRTGLPARLERIFVSRERVADLAALLKVDIVQRLVPALQKEGYEEDADQRAAREDADAAARGREPARPAQPPPDPRPEPARPYPFDDPLAAPPPRPTPAGDFAPPGFEDEYEVLRPAWRGGAGPPPFLPAIGGDDLHPPGLGPHDPLRPSFVGGLPRPRGGGGMHPAGLDDPLFGGPRGGGQAGFDPQVPPGARYDDPTGGFGSLPRFGGGRPGGSGGNNPYGGFGGDII